MMSSTTGDGSRRRQNRLNSTHGSATRTPRRTSGPAPVCHGDRFRQIEPGESIGGIEQHRLAGDAIDDVLAVPPAQRLVVAGAHEQNPRAALGISRLRMILMMHVQDHLAVRGDAVHPARAGLDAAHLDQRRRLVRAQRSPADLHRGCAAPAAG